MQNLISNKTDNRKVLTMVKWTNDLPIIITGEDSETWSDKLLKSSKKYFDIESKMSLTVIFGLVLGALALIVVLATMPALAI